MATRATLIEQLAILGIRLAGWPDEPNGNQGDWIQRGLAYAEGIQLWRAQLRNASVNTKTVVDHLMRHLKDSEQLGVWDQLVYAAMRPEVLGSPEHERWQVCTKLIRSSELSAAQLLGISLEMGREQRLTAATYGIKRLLKENASLKPDERLALFSHLIAAANTQDVMKDAKSSSKCWVTAMELHRHWINVLLQCLRLEEHPESDKKTEAAPQRNMLATLESINEKLGEKGAHGHARFIQFCKDRLPALLKDWHGERPWIVEVGCSREIVEGQNSTVQLLGLAEELLLPFAGIDMDEANIFALQRDYADFDAKWITGKGENVMAAWDRPIAACYLDAYDIWHSSHSEIRQEAYLKNYGSTINNADSQQMHFQVAKYCTKLIPDGGILGVDDTWIENGKWEGKGALAVPWLLEQGWQLLSRSNRSTVLLASKKTD
jgi:hypothetical protein